MTIIDATNKSLGRIAGEVALHLRGKNSPSFAPNKIPQSIVKVVNLGKISFYENKKEQKIYKRYSGYPGGLKEISFKKLTEKKPQEFFRLAVWGMLPKNKLRKIMMKNLILEN